MILVTGGAGYIGSHTVVELLQAGFDVLVVDNYANSDPGVMDRVRGVVGETVASKLLVVTGDVRDRSVMRALFSSFPIQAVIHFAGLKAVGESVAEPLRYFECNLGSTMVLLETMQAFGVKNLVFSSSATVYGDPASVPIREDFPLQATNPYGRTKLMIEEMLRDLYRADASWRIAILRYFNPIGAHPSGVIGENPRGIPNNLMPYCSQVAAGRLDRLRIFGNDYPTPDGTGVRDYIHVVDLSLGHLRALETLSMASEGQLLTVNLGTGQGYSVLQILSALSEVVGRSLPYEFVARRPGDVAQCFADPSAALQLLGWRAERDLATMCQDTWRWQQWAESHLKT